MKLQLLAIALCIACAFGQTCKKTSDCKSASLVCAANKTCVACGVTGELQKPGIVAPWGSLVTAVRWGVKQDVIMHPPSSRRRALLRGKLAPEEQGLHRSHWILLQ